MVKFKCKNCNYVLKPRTWDIKNKCPYCGKEGTLHTDEAPQFSDVDSLLG